MLFGRLSVLINDGKGAFPGGIAIPNVGLPYDVTAADLDGNGHPDFAFAVGPTVGVMLGKGNGVFGPRVDYPAQARAIWAADLNGDGKPDLVVVNETDAMSVLLNDGTGAFALHVDYPAGPQPYAVAAADLNGDGKVDLAVANGGNASVSVRFNDGNGAFGPTVDYTAGAQPRSVTAADLDGDGHPDLIVANQGGDSVSVLLNQGDGTFAAPLDYAAGAKPHAVTAADLDGDGHPDLAVTHEKPNLTVSVLLNQGGGILAPGVDYPMDTLPVTGGTIGGHGALAVVELNGDGKPDLAAMNTLSGFSTSAVTALINDGAGTFTSAGTYPTYGDSRALAAADVNGDGRPDLAVLQGGSATMELLFTTCLP